MRFYFKAKAIFRFRIGRAPQTPSILILPNVYARRLLSPKVAGSGAHNAV